MVDTLKYKEWFEMAKKDLKGSLILKTDMLQENQSLIRFCKKAIIHNN
jgi:hypothetical protein